MWRFFLLFKPRCAYFWMLSLLGSALARQENIYTGTVNTDMLWCLYYLGVRIIRVSILSKLSGRKSQTSDLFDILHKGTRGRRVGTMTVAKSQGHETCWVGGRKFIKDYRQGKKERCIKIKCVMLFGCRYFGNKILLTRELGTMSIIRTSLWQEIS